jgi:hypothetical protein
MNFGAFSFDEKGCGKSNRGLVGVPKRLSGDRERGEKRQLAQS